MFRSAQVCLARLFISKNPSPQNGNRNCPDAERVSLTTLAPTMQRQRAMDPILQLLVVLPFLILFAMIIVPLMRQENQRMHRIEALYERRYVAQRTRVKSAERPSVPVRIQKVDEASVESHDAPDVRHAA